MMEASLGIAVFTENKATYEDAMSKFAGRVPAYIYLTSDGPYPVPGRDVADTPASLIKYWQGQQYFNISGITQETCRDYAHTSYGISSMSHIAETSRIQGKDLWGTSLGVRVKAALELHSSFETGEQHIPAYICGGNIARSMDPGKLTGPTKPHSKVHSLISSFQFWSLHTMLLHIACTNRCLILTNCWKNSVPPRLERRNHCLLVSRL
jgi:hypothetical protein